VKVHSTKPTPYKSPIFIFFEPYILKNSKIKQARGAILMYKMLKNQLVDSFSSLASKESGGLTFLTFLCLNKLF